MAKTEKYDFTYGRANEKISQQDDESMAVYSFIITDINLMANTTKVRPELQ